MHVQSLGFQFYRAIKTILKQRNFHELYEGPCVLYESLCRQPAGPDSYFSEKGFKFIDLEDYYQLLTGLGARQVRAAETVDDMDGSGSPFFDF